MSSQSFSFVVLISGNGSNLQAIIDAVESGLIPGELTAVISDQADAFGITRANQANIATKVIRAQARESREDYDARLQAYLETLNPDLIVLAGFMRILSAKFVNHYLGKIINIHPSLLPRYRGLHTHERVIAAQETEHGTSIHFVTAELDGGPIICQERLNVTPNETAEQLKQRVQALEHQIYPAIIAKFAQGEIVFSENPN